MAQALTAAVAFAGARRRASPYPEALALLAGLILPNAAYFVGQVADVGSPLRAPILGLYLCVVALSRWLPSAVALGAYLAALLFDFVWTLTVTFHMPPSSALDAFRFTSELHLFDSPFYMALIVGTGISTAGVMTIIVRHRETLRRASMVPTALATLVVAGLDSTAVVANQVVLPALRGAPATPESAVRKSGFGEAVLRPGAANALLVITESMGAFANPAHRALLLRPFDDPRIRRAYDVSSGTVPFYGSTTSAEMRELCGRGETYTALTTEAAHDCMPHQLSRAGRRTAAIHGFSGTMFDRETWYPIAGFQRSDFAETLHDRLTRRCGWVFSGLCDNEIGQNLPRLLRRGSAATFTYWLTLNSHVPVRPNDASARLGCDDGGPLGHVEVCRMTELWIDVMEAVAAAALNEHVGPLEVLIVGDHAPPMWSRRGRALFTPGEVAWIRLSPKAGGSIPAARRPDP